MTPPSLDLYYFDACPFCQMVLQVIKKHNIFVNYFDIWENPVYAEKLVQDRGRRTVPVLYIDGVPMGESSDIISWIEANKDKLEKVSK